MTLQIDEGFEGPGYEESWSEVGSGAIDDQNQDITIDGSYVCEFVTTAAQNAYIQRALANDTIPSTSLFYFFMKFNASAWSDSDTLLFDLNDNTFNVNVRAETENSGGDNYIRLRYYNNGGFATQLCDQIIALDTTYSIEVLYDPVGNTFECWIDDVPQFTPITLTGTLRAGLRYVQVGHKNTDGWAGTLYADTIKADDADRIGGGGATLVIADTSQAQTLDNLDMIQQHVLGIDSVNQAQALGGLALIQANVLVVNGTDQPQTLGNLTLSVGGTLEMAGSAQAQALDNFDLIQANVLATDPTTQAQTVGNITLSAGVILDIADMAQTQGIDAVTLIQQSTIAPDGVDQSQTLGQITLDTGILLGIADIIQNQPIENLNLTQAGNLAIDPLEQGQIIDNVVFSQVEGKIIITLTIKSPGIDTAIKSPGIDMGVS